MNEPVGVFIMIFCNLLIHWWSPVRSYIFCFRTLCVFTLKTVNEANSLIIRKKSEFFPSIYVPPTPPRFAKRSCIICSHSVLEETAVSCMFQGREKRLLFLQTDYIYISSSPRTTNLAVSTASTDYQRLVSTYGSEIKK